MKKIFYLTLSLFFGINFNSKAQNVSQTKTELNKVLCKTWQADYAMMNGMRINQLPNNIAFELEFNSDNSYLVIKEKTKQKGKWTFNEKKKYIDLSINNKTNSRITKISENELILVLVSDGKNNPPGLPNMEIYCKTK
ncbi:hypothetical protein [Flavobacterium sp. ASV13]|uniref:hypothetical protein n=1 Tax=Flavobacterium sp. ASV13 TaxID=1506583 RepID=UPI000555C0A9|nr:hypothetical protein [Flavobacterium sp. ASV13]